MIIVYGGSFNPPTLAHYKIADYIIKTLKPNQLLFLPVGDHYPKKGLVSASHRVNMLTLLANRLPRVTVETLEVDHETVLTSFESLKLLQQKYQKQELAFVIGADNLKSLSTWSQVNDLISTYKIIVLGRANLNVDALIVEQFKGYESQFIVLEGFLELDISSTMYRNCQTTKQICLTEVDEYAHQFKLYGRGD